jgi:hypothetical protein
MVFRATESDLRRLLKGTEKASNQDLEVLRGSERFLKGCTDDKDCNKHGKCDIKQNDTEGDCKCNKGYEGDKCEDQVVEYNIRLVVDETMTRSVECEQALEDLKKSLKDLPDTIPADKSGKHSRDRRLGNSKKYEVDIVIRVDNTCTTRGVGGAGDGLLDQVEDQLDEYGIKIKEKGGSRDI